MRRLMTAIAILLGTTLLAPAALAQTERPGISLSALDGQIKVKPTKTRRATHAKKRAVHRTVRKAGLHRKATKAKARAHRAPAKQAVISGQMLV